MDFSSFDLAYLLPFIGVGFAAQLVDGALGMAFGVISNTLLVKPDMSHLETYPDLFEAGETYVPILWNMSNLRDTLEQVRGDQERVDRIKRNALRNN